MGGGTQPTQSSKNQVGRGHERLQRGEVIDLESLHNETSGLPEEVWEHIDFYNFQGANEKPNVPHSVHEKRGNRPAWDRNRSGRDPLSNQLTCGKCAGKAAINFLRRGNPEGAIGVVQKFEATRRRLRAEERN